MCMICEFCYQPITWNDEVRMIKFGEPHCTQEEKCVDVEQVVVP